MRPTLRARRSRHRLAPPMGIGPSDLIRFFRFFRVRKWGVKRGGLGSELDPVGHQISHQIREAIAKLLLLGRLIDYEENLGEVSPRLASAGLGLSRSLMPRLGFALLLLHH